MSNVWMDLPAGRKLEQPRPGLRRHDRPAPTRRRAKPPACTPEPARDPGEAHRGRGAVPARQVERRDARGHHVVRRFGRPEDERCHGVHDPRGASRVPAAGRMEARGGREPLRRRGLWPQGRAEGSHAHAGDPLRWRAGASLESSRSATGTNGRGSSGVLETGRTRTGFRLIWARSSRRRSSCRLPARSSPQASRCFRSRADVRLPVRTRARSIG